MNRSVHTIQLSPWAGDAAQKIELAGGREQRILAPLRLVEQRIEQALAHAERRDHHILGPRYPHQVLEHERRIGKQRTPRVGHHLDLRQRLGIDPVHQAGEIERLAGRDHIAVHDMQRIAGLPHVQARQRAPGAADRIKRAAGAGLEQVRAAERLLDDLLGLLERFRGDVLQREPAERQRDAGPDAMAADIGELERSAAEITHDAVRPMKAGHDPERAQLGLALAGDQLDLGAADALGRGDEGLAVGGVPAGGGRQHEQLRHLDPVAQHAEPAQRGKRLLHRIGGQEPGRLHLAAKAAKHLLVEDGGGAAGQPLVHHQAHGVRADVDDGDRRAVVEPALRRPLVGEPPPSGFNQADG